MHDDQPAKLPTTVAEIKAMDAKIDWSGLEVPKATVGGSILPPEPVPPKARGWWSKLSRR